MDRLTYWNEEYRCWSCHGASGDAAERLAAYEDTGLEPEEVTAIKHAFMGREIAKITEFEGIPIKRLQELAQAEKDGRLVVLPCKVGDTVYRVMRVKGRERYIVPATVAGVHLGDTENSRYRKGNEYIVLKKDGGYVAHVDKKNFGKTIFLTREAAEAVLEGEPDETNPI